MDALKLDKKTPVEEVAQFSFVENKAIAVCFWIGMIGIVMMRKRIGVRMLRIENVVFTITGLFFFAHIANYFSQLPFIGKGLSYSSFKVFMIIYGICAIGHMIRGFIDSRRIPYTYTRSLGISLIQDVVFKMNLPFIGQSVSRLQAIVEPFLYFIIAEVVYHFLSPSLGAFMIFICVCMIVMEVVQFHNAERIRHDQNDAIILAKHTQHNVKDNKTHKPQSRVMSQVSKSPNKKP